MKCTQHRVDRDVFPTGMCRYDHHTLSQCIELIDFSLESQSFQNVPHVSVSESHCENIPIAMVVSPIDYTMLYIIFTADMCNILSGKNVCLIILLLSVFSNIRSNGV